MRRTKGFTVIELLVVLAALSVLLALAAPRYAEHVDRARENVLRHNLHAMRQAIDRFMADRGRYPATLAELADARYLRELPIDPMTDRSDTWQPVAPSALAAATGGVSAGLSGGGSSGVADVRSGAPGQAKDGGRYADW
jgi:general secretion pathway protein G